MNLSDSRSGLILIDKKPGITSMNVDSYVKKLLGTKKVGHHGTLDPFATGLLPVYTGKALRFVRYADDFDKSYRCVAVFGKSTDSMDRDGEVTGGRMPTADELEKLEAEDYKSIRELFEQEALITEQMPPKFSAKKINGRKAYELARKGDEVELKPHKVKIFSITINEIRRREDTFEADFTVECSKGTYIRTICDDIGKMSGFGAYADSLRRMSCGPFRVEDAYSEEELKTMADSGDWSFMADPEITLDYMPKIMLSDSEYKDVRLGRKIPADSHMNELLENDSGTTKYRALYEGRVTAVMYTAMENGRKLLRIERMLATDD